MNAQPLPEWVKAILREKYPRPDPLAEAMKGAAQAFEAFSAAVEKFLATPLLREKP